MEKHNKLQNCSGFPCWENSFSLLTPAILYCLEAIGIKTEDWGANSAMCRAFISTLFYIPHAAKTSKPNTDRSSAGSSVKHPRRMLHWQDFKVFWNVISKMSEIESEYSSALEIQIDLPAHSHIVCQVL